MTISSVLRRSIACLSLATSIACGRLPDFSNADIDLPAEPPCYEGHDGPVAVTICEVTDRKLLADFRAERWLPRQIRPLRAKSALRHGSEQSASLEIASLRAKSHHSYLIPHFDVRYPISGWDLYDVDERIALLSLVFDERWVMTYSETAATSAARVRRSLKRFLEAPDPIATRAQVLYTR